MVVVLSLSLSRIWVYTVIHGSIYMYAKEDNFFFKFLGLQIERIVVRILVYTWT